MAPALPIGRSGDFGTSPFLGNSRTSDGLNRALPYIVSDLLDSPKRSCRMRGIRERCLLVALTDDSGMSALPPLLGDEPTHYAHDECAFDPKETSNHRAVGRHS